MSKGDWWFKFEYSKWDDANLRRCTFEAQGFWLRVYAEMRKADTCSLSGTVEDFQRMFGGLPSEIKRAIVNLAKHKVADVTPVTLCNGDVTGNVTLVSRERKKALSEREQTRLRVQKHRSNGDVTVNVTRHSKSKSNKKKKEKKESAANAAPTPHKRGMAILQKVIGDFPDGEAQGKALKWMLGKGATISQIERGIIAQHAEYSAKGLRASYLTLQKTIFQKPPPDILSPDYECTADHTPFDVVMPHTPMDRDRYPVFRAEWLEKNSQYADEVERYERSSDYRERFGQAESGNAGSSTATGRGNGHGPQEAQMPVP